MAGTSSFGAARARKKLSMRIVGVDIGSRVIKVALVEDGIAPDSCTGMKNFMTDIEENAADQYMALSRRYLEIPCACMTPNDRRLGHLDRMIERFRPDVVVDVILHACHTHNVESRKVMDYIQDRHGLPFLKIETDYSTGDAEQIRTSVEALFDGLK